MHLPQIINIKGIRVVTSEQLAEMYGTDRKTISYNYTYNKDKYIKGKHFYKVEKEELKALKTSREIPDYLKYAKSLYLWTEKGALLHAKSLNTDKAWEVYDYLVDFYFRAKEPQAATTPEQPKIEDKKEIRQIKPMTVTVADIPENAEAQNLIKEIKRLMTGVDVLLDKYNMYQPEDTIKGVTAALQSISADISMAVFKICRLKPKMIEKKY